MGESGQYVIRDRGAHVLDTGVVRSREVDRSTSGVRLALRNFVPPSHPLVQLLSHLWLAVPGLYNVLASTNLRSHKSKDLEWTSTSALPPREQVLQLKGHASGASYGLGRVRYKRGKAQTEGAYQQRGQKK